MTVVKWFANVLVCFILLPSVNAENNSFLKVTNAYMPEVPSVSRSAAIYLTLSNTSPNLITLTGVSTSIAKHSMIHRTVESDGMVKMMHHADLNIKPGDSIEFRPGGIHIMLMGLQSTPIPTSFKLNLIFKEQSQQVEVNLRSRKY